MSNNILTHRALLTRVSVSMFTLKRLNRRATRDLESREGAKHGSAEAFNRLIAKEYTDPVTAAANEVRMASKLYTAPWGDDKWRVCPITMHQKHDEKVGAAIGKFYGAVDTLCEAYERDDIPARSQALLGALWRAENYPTVHVLRSHYAASSHYRPVPDEEDFRVSLQECDLQRFRQDTIDAQATMMREPWTRAIAAVNRMVDSLSKADPRIFSTLTSNVVDVAEFMEAFNINGDPVMAQLAVELRSKLVPSGNVEAETERLRNGGRAVLDDRRTAAEEILRKMRGAMGQ